MILCKENSFCCSTTAISSASKFESFFHKSFQKTDYSIITTYAIYEKKNPRNLTTDTLKAHTMPYIKLYTYSLHLSFLNCKGINIKTEHTNETNRGKKVIFLLKNVYNSSYRNVTKLN